jgi:hypothetical protein
MGTDNSPIEFSSGTLYFSKPEEPFEELGKVTEMDVKSVEEEVEDAMRRLLMFNNEEATFTATCELSFKAEAILFGFRKAVWRRIRRIFMR